MKKFKKNEVKLIEIGYKSLHMLFDKFEEYIKRNNSDNKNYDDDEIYTLISSALRYFIEEALEVDGDEFVIEYRSNISRGIRRNSVFHNVDGYIDYLSYSCAFGYYAGYTQDSGNTKG